MWLQIAFLLTLSIGINIECNPHICPPISVIFKQRGDSLCDQECMTSSCNFDSQKNMEGYVNYSDCKCMRTGADWCQSSWLGDGVCDEACNNWLCGYDYGDCGYCAPSCFQWQLGGSCDLECNTTSCLYDYGACLDCAIGCNSTILGDGVCNAECNNNECNFDNGDCFNLTCAPNCNIWMINNSICDEACYVEECNFDGNDCDCSPRCFSELLENGECDEACNNFLCEWDGGDCGYCESGCFLDMLINDACDDACNSFACKYDYYACKCNDDCFAEDYGKCKPECLTADCMYDQISPDPNKRCNDIDLIQYTLYQQAIYSDPRRIVYFDNCSSVSSSQCSLPMAISQTECYSECNFIECNYGLCNLTSDCYSLPFDAWSLCKIWWPSAWNFDLNQNSYTNNAYFLNMTIAYTSKYKKAKIPDFSIYHATSIQEGSSPSGLGTSFSPFETLDYAFNQIFIWNTETNVLLLANDGNYSFTQPWEWRRWGIKSVTIKTYDKNKITIKINGWLQLSFDVQANMRFENVIFDGSGQYDTCDDSAYCEYCSFTTYNETDGFYYNDRNQPVSQALPLLNCMPSESLGLSLFTVDGLTFTLKNVIIKNFRFNYDFIIFGFGDLKLYDVNFDNIKLSGSKESAVISALVSMVAYYDFKITYIGGSVTRLNNGYEFGDPLDFCGFLNARLSSSILIKSVDFKYNLVYRKPQSSLARASLIYVDLTNKIEIDNCTFMHNYCETGLIYTNLDISAYTADYNETSYLNYLLLPSIYIHDSKFVSNYGSLGLIYINFLDKLLNVYMNNLIIESNGVDNGSLVYIYNPYILDEYEFETWGNLEVLTTKTIPVILPPRWCKIFNIYFKNNHALGMLTTTNLVHFELKNITIDSNGSANEDKNINTLLLNNFINDRGIEDLYISKSQNNPKTIDCGFMASLSNSLYFSIFNLSLLNNTCRNGSPNIQIYQSDINEFATINCANNSGNGPLSICLFFTGNMDRNLSNAIFKGNTNHFASSGYGAVQIESENKLYVENCSFIENSAGLASAVYFLGQSILISNSTFISNESKQGVGGGLYFISSISAVNRSVIIKTSDFWDNSAYTNGGAVFLEEKSSLIGGIELIIIETTFIRNNAAYGSALYIDQSVSLSQDSIISSSKFQKNYSSQSGSIFLQYSKGVILIQNCEFIENASVLSAVLHVDIAEDTSSLHSIVKIEFSSFRNNEGKSIIYGDNENRNSSIETKNCLFEHNQGIVVYLDFDYFSDNGSIFQNNKAPYASCFYLQDSAILYASSQFLNNTSEKYGGVIAISFKSIFHCNHCEFINNQALTSKGGVLVSEQDSQFFISNSKFIKNSGGLDGSAIFVFYCNSSASSIESTDFLNNHASGSGVIVLISSKISISSSKISSNSAEIQTSGIKLTYSNANIYDTIFENQSSVSGSFIHALAESYAYIQNSNFFRGYSDESGGAIYSSSSTLKIESSSFSQLYSPQGGAIYCAFESTLVIRNCEFFDLQNSTESGIINANQATLLIKNSRISEFSSTGIYGNQLKRLEVENSTFKNGLGYNGGAIWCESCKKINIKSTNFENNSAVSYGGALYFSTGSKIKTLQEISLSRFTNNTAQNGGAIYSNDISISISSSLFEKNYAISSQNLDKSADFGKGGGILVSCSTFQSCKLIIQSNNFWKNTATYNGGAINWDYKLPIFTNNTFLENFAEYGNDIASFAIKLMKINENGTFEGYKNIKESIDPVSILNLTEIASGQKIANSLLIALVDNLDNIVSTDNWSEAELSAINSTTQISGKIKLTSMKGVFNFSDFIISEAPGSDIQIMVSSSAIDTDKLKNSGESFFSKNLIFNVNMRECKIGEVKSGKNCEVCPKGFYSLNPNLISCIACPSTAICYGNWTMVPKPGYWRDNIYTDNFWECPHPSACLGSTNQTSLSYTGECSKAYKGNKCQSCKPGYAHSFYEECKECLSLKINILAIVGIALLLLLLLFFIVKETRKSAFKPKSQISVYMKILLNYLQLIIPVSAFKLNWSSEVLEIFKYQSNSDYIRYQIYSFQCLLQDSGSQDFAYYRTLLVIALIPFLLIILLILFYIILKLIKSSYPTLWDDFISTCIILLFLIHPSIVKSMFASMNCTEINNGEYWLEENLDIRCWNYDHYFYVMALSLPTIIIWGIILPTVCLFNLIRNKEKLKSISIRVRYGFLFNGYKEKNFYWEFIILYSKIALICCSVFLTRTSVQLQGVLVMILYTIYFRLQYSNNPYSEDDLNKTELCSKFVCLVTIYCGLFYLMGSLNDGAGYFFFILIAAANIYFLCFIIYCISKTILNKMNSRISQWRHRVSNQSEESKINSEIIDDSRSVINSRIEVSSISSNDNFLNSSQAMEEEKKDSMYSKKNSEDNKKEISE